MKKLINHFIVIQLLYILIPTNSFASPNELVVKITWQSGASRTDFDLFVLSPNGNICNYGGEGGNKNQNEWGCVHVKDQTGSPYVKSYEAFRINLDKMDDYAYQNNLIGPTKDYKFMISRYLGPNIKVRFSYGDASNCSIYDANDCPKGAYSDGRAWEYTISQEGVQNAQFSVRYNTTSSYSEYIGLRKSRWTQPTQKFTVDGISSKYALGCTAVAVGQLVNYYLQSGFEDGWLDSLGNHVVVYPRFENQMRNFTMPSLSTLNKYNYHHDTNDSDIKALLLSTALLLDSNFEKGGAGVGLYAQEPPQNAAWDDKIESLLEDRFRFEARSFSLTKDRNARAIYEKYLRENKPLILGMTLIKSDKKVSRHAVLMDGYRVNKTTGKSEFRINFGWGDGPGSGSCSDNWFALETNTLDLQCDGRFVDAWIDGVIIASPNDTRSVTP